MAKKTERRGTTARPQSAYPAQDYSKVWMWLTLVAGVGVFIWSCMYYQLTQDDAYISFRYAENFLLGHGLVFNIGERVEGYTNFLWVIVLALLKGLFGIDYLMSSRVLGVASGSALFYMLYLLVRRNYESGQPLFYVGLVIAMLSNLSLAYWSIASLETAAFVCMAFATIVAEFTKPRLTPGFLIIASLLRPEGAVVFGAILINRIVTNRKVPYQFILLYVAPLLPFAAFKLSYYGSLFPNPYYAKSGVGIEYIVTGLEYLWDFTKTVGLYGIVFLIPILAIKKLWEHYSLLYIFVAIYIAYIVWVGGDVLKVYRFFVPVIPALYFLFVASLYVLVQSFLKEKTRAYAIVFLATTAFSFGSLKLSKGHVDTFWYYEQNIVRKMHFMGTMLKKYMGSEFSLATSTIGMISYTLMGHRVIDMLGLTDAQIAKNPEKIDGLTSTWKERRFNNTYLLSQSPDFILFSTGYKPSAPAERALMLHSEFRDNYSPTGFLRENQYKVIWRRVRDIDMSKDVVHPDAQFVQTLSDAIYHTNRSTPDVALEFLNKARGYLDKDYSVIEYSIGDAFAKMNRADSALYYFTKVANEDSNAYEARIRLIRYAAQRGDTAYVNQMGEALRARMPWIFDDSYISPFKPIPRGLPESD